MRKIVLIMIAGLTLTGLPIAYGWIAGTSVASGRGGWEQAGALAHLWGGVFFIVIFPLYAWDHITTNRRWLSRLAGVTVSGLGQLTVGVLLILSGVLLFLYGDQVWRALRVFHHWLTYPLLAALAAHFLSPKR